MPRTITARLTLAEYKAVMWAIGNMTDANARDIDEMLACGMTRREAKNLLQAEAKLIQAESASFWTDPPTA
jgi:hypothetical protein